MPGPPGAALGGTPGRLRTLQEGEYETWCDRMPESLADARELLDEVCDVDLDALGVELARWASVAPETPGAHAGIMENLT